MNKKLTQILCIFILLLAMLPVFAACSNKVPAALNSITFTDALGREVTIEKEPQRVAALIGSFADIWVLSGGNVCAAPEEAWTDYQLDLQDAVNIGGAHSPNLELLLSAEPDFVIASASTASNVEMLEILESAQIAVAYFDVDNFEDYLQMLDICTTLTGRKDLYEQNGLEIQKKIESIKAEFVRSCIRTKDRTK